MINNLLLLANAITPIQTTISSGGFDWRPIVYSLILCVFTAVVQWWFHWRKGASKRDTNHFVAFMDESTEFREEMRKDREGLKKEFEGVVIEKDQFKFKLLECQTKLEECFKTIKSHSAKLEIAQEDIIILHAKIKNLKEALDNGRNKISTDSDSV
jgi:hypothetical protein